MQKRASVQAVSVVELAIRQAEDLRQLVKAARKRGVACEVDTYDDIVSAMLAKYPMWEPCEQRLRDQVASVALADRGFVRELLGSLEPERAIHARDK
jgi:hypothetical protein